MQALTTDLRFCLSAPPPPIYKKKSSFYLLDSGPKGLFWWRWKELNLPPAPRNRTVAVDIQTTVYSQVFTLWLMRKKTNVKTDRGFWSNSYQVLVAEAAQTLILLRLTNINTTSRSVYRQHTVHMHHQLYKCWSLLLPMKKLTTC